jgi:hypothetical protein
VGQGGGRGRGKEREIPKVCLKEHRKKGLKESH